MLKLHYSRQTIEANLKEAITELASTFSQFDKFDEGARRDYLENSYAPKIVSIASNLNELGIHPFQSAPENFDPRYVQEYKGNWTKEIDEKARINQKLHDFLEKHEIAQTPEARFVLYNSLLYLDGKEVDEFKQRKEDVSTARKPGLKNFIISIFKPASLDTESLVELSEKSFDYLECPFDGSMDGFCSSIFAKDNKVYARFSREEFEEYMLKKAYDELALKLNGKRIEKEALVKGTLSREIEDIFSREEFEEYMLKRVYDEFVSSIKGTYSDSAVERLEKRLDSSSAASSIITSALKHAVRTKTCLNFEGKDRDFFLAQTDLIGDEIRISDVGDYGLSGISDFSYPNYKIGKLTVGHAGNDLGKWANFTSDVIELTKVGEWALSCNLSNEKLSTHNIGKLTVGHAGNHFGRYVNFTSDVIELTEVGEWALAGDRSNHKIGKLTIGRAGNYLGYNANFTADVIELTKVGERALTCSYIGESNHKIGKLTVGQAGDGFGDGAKFTEDSIRTNYKYALEGADGK